MKKRDGIMTFRLPDEEKAKLVMFAEAGDCTLSDLAVKAIRELIERMERGDDEKPSTKKRK